jgi:hypothetical protein
MSSGFELDRYQLDVAQHQAVAEALAPLTHSPS